MAKLLASQVAKGAKMHPDTVRRAEKRGLISSVRDINGWRRYSEDTIEKLLELYGGGGEKRENV